MIPFPPPPDAPEAARDPRHGPGDLPAVTWGAFESLALFIVGNLALGQVLVAGIVLAVMGVQPTEDVAGLPTIVATIAADLTFFGVMLLFFRWRAPDWRRRVGVFLGRDRLRDVAFGFGGGLLLYGIVAVVVGAPLLWLFREVFGQQVSQPEQIATNISAGAKVLAVLSAVVIAPITEELYFRGILYRSVRDRRGVALGVLVQALVFGAVHAPAAPWRDVLFLQTLMCFTGAGLALIYERRANLAASIAAHMAFNIIGVIAIFHGA